MKELEQVRERVEATVDALRLLQQHECDAIPETCGSFATNLAAALASLAAAEERVRALERDVGALRAELRVGVETIQGSTQAGSALYRQNARTLDLLREIRDMLGRQPDIVQEDGERGDGWLNELAARIDAELGEAGK